jgi:quercetin dioxygenase-like cupin family protein
MDPILLEPGEGDGSNERRTKVSNAQIGVVEFDVEKDEVATHTHEQDELFYVLDGHMMFGASEEKKELGPGGFVFVPRGTAHWFFHTKPARYLVISAPGGLESYFAEVEKAENDGADDGKRAEIAAKHGTSFVD